jgi:hypothetical protein
MSRGRNVDLNATVWLIWPEGGRSRRIRRNPGPRTEEKRRKLRRLGAPQVDPFHQESKDSEAEPTVPSARRGVARSSGAMARSSRWWRRETKRGERGGLLAARGRRGDGARVRRGRRGMKKGLRGSGSLCGGGAR